MSEHSSSIGGIASQIAAIRGGIPLEWCNATAFRYNQALVLLTGAAENSGSPQLEAIREQLLAAGVGLAAADIAMRRTTSSLQSYTDMLIHGDSPGPESTPAPAISEQPSQHERITYMTGRGFALFTDVNDRMLHTLQACRIPAAPRDMELTITHWNEPSAEVVRLNPAGTGLFIATYHLQQLLPRYDDLTFNADHGISSEDTRESGAYTFFDSGFNDLNFPWHFSATVANAVVDFFVSEGVITQQQKDAFTLRDWADVIGSGWFSRIMHLMALTSNGSYGSFGQMLTTYMPGALTRRLAERKYVAHNDAPLFTYKAQVDPQSGLTHHTAVLRDEVIRAMRASMRATQKSVGCPVARYSVLLPEAEVTSNPHVQHLIRNGTLQVVPERSHNGMVRLIQEQSAIDKTLTFFAHQLDQYDRSHGTPRVQLPRPGGDRRIIQHIASEPVQALYWPTPLTPSQQ